MAKEKKEEVEIALKCKVKDCGKVYTKVNQLDVDKDHKIYCECGYCFGTMFDAGNVKQRILNNAIGDELIRIKADIDKVSKIIVEAEKKKFQIKELTKKKNDLKDELSTAKRMARKKHKEYLDIRSSKKAKSKLNASKVDTLKSINEALKTTDPDLYNDLYPNDDFVASEIKAIKKREQESKEKKKRKEDEVLSEFSKYTAKIVNLDISIERIDKALNELHGLSKYNKEVVTKKREVYLDESVKSLSKHFIEKTGKPRNGLTGGLFLLFDLFRKPIDHEGCDYRDESYQSRRDIEKICKMPLYNCRKVQDRIKKRLRSLSI